MPDLEAVIDEHVRGNDLDVIRTVTVIPSGQTVAEAWLRVDEITPPGTEVFSKHITPTLVAGEGQIEDDGSVDGIAILRFEITHANSLLLDPAGTVAAPKAHPYAIQIKTSGGKIYEFEQGVINCIDEIVVAA